MRSSLDAHSTPEQARRQFRANAWNRPTAGLCAGYYQANLVIVPGDLAPDFAGFCAANPQPLPVLEQTQPGDPRVLCASGADLRTDSPRYRIYRDGKAVSDVPDIFELWQDDFVGFILGCSFSAEQRLVEAGIRLRHLDRGAGGGVPIYRTTIPCRTSGVFRGPLVVSMRPIRLDQVVLAADVTKALPLAHGGPLHVGAPAEIGITDLDHPDWGVPLMVEEGEVPVFWACGVTPQAALAQVRPPLAITHSPGFMFITDIPLDGAERRAPLR